MKQPKKNDIAKIGKKLAKKQAPVLGVIRLDYNYPPAAGDIDCPGSYEYDVLYRVVPGLTFDMAQAGVMTTPVLKEFKLAVKWLESKGAVGITGDCGFMMAFQPCLHVLNGSMPDDQSGVRQVRQSLDSDSQ